MKRRSFTVTELLVSLSIVVLLAGCTFAVLAVVKRQSMATVSSSNLHQLYTAISLYRTEYDGDGVYGPTTAMGLSLASSQVTVHKYHLPLEVWKSPCGDHPSRGPGVMNLTYFPGDGSDLWNKNIHLFLDNMFLIADMNCTDPGALLDNDEFTKLGRGVLLGGQATIRRRRGDWGKPSWWADPYVE
ncbi:MAG: hypothetical protein JNM34_06305 [Chthonomonadaceae bacterium]|nr:hypothetical protein [Chthonomonadaceae bacterium]